MCQRRRICGLISTHCAFRNSSAVTTDHHNIVCVHSSPPTRSLSILSACRAVDCWCRTSAGLIVQGALAAGSINQRESVLWCMWRFQHGHFYFGASTLTCCPLSPLAPSFSPRPSVDLHFGSSLSLALYEFGSTQFAVRMPSSGFLLPSSRTPFVFQPLWIVLQRGNGQARSRWTTHTLTASILLQEVGVQVARAEPLHSSGCHRGKHRRYCP
jgi:hypothetical protein